MEYLTINEQDVVRTISPNDEMYGRDKTHGSDVYWSTGRSSLDAIEQCLRAARKPLSSVRSILDLPCGHGRVLRYLKAAFPAAEITACDLLEDGVKFCAETFGAKPIKSHEDPGRIELPLHAFDLIWVGSLLTHLDAERWGAFLTCLSSYLHENGVLVFTAHGRYVYRRIKGLEDPYDYFIPYWRKTVALYDYENKGFGYGDYGKKGYGISISDPAWVSALLAQQSELRCVLFQERGWTDVHDVYACVRQLRPRDSESATSIALYLKHRIRELWKPSR